VLLQGPNCLGGGTEVKGDIVRNRIKCLSCGDVIESYTVHDFKFCGCEKVAVDGGKDYLQRVGDLMGYEELSEYEEEEKVGSNVLQFPTL